MKKPTIADLNVDVRGTRRMREAAMRGRKSIKITINIDAESLGQLKALSTESGVPYQRLLNEVLRQGLSKRSTISARLDRLEKDVTRLKKKLAA